MEIITDFQSYLYGLGYGVSALKQYPSYVGMFLSYIEKDYLLVDKEAIWGYYEYLSNRPGRDGLGLSSSYVCQHLYALRLFYRWQAFLGNLVNPMSGLVFPKVVSVQRFGLDIGEIERLYEYSESLLERALLGIFYGCGLRRSEGVHLRLSDIDYGRGLLEVRKSKGGGSRLVPFGGRVSEDLRAYRDYGHSGKSLSYFSGLQGAYEGETLNIYFKALVYRAGIYRRLSLHHLRHSIASHLLAKGMDIEQLRLFLGHKSLSATELYLSE